jgi:hypothetical protein
MADRSAPPAIAQRGLKNPLLAAGASVQESGL